MEPLPDLSALDKKALESLLLDLYDRSCKAFGATFDIQQEIKVEEYFLIYSSKDIIRFPEAWCSDSWSGDGGEWYEWQVCDP